MHRAQSEPAFTLFFNNHTFKSLTNQHGLPLNSVYEIYQDKSGFIWIGTGEGLCRFDGLHTKTYPLAEKTNLKGNINFINQGKAIAPNGDMYWSGRFGMVVYRAEQDSCFAFFPKNDTATFNNSMRVLGILQNKLYFTDLNSRIFNFDLLSQTLQTIHIPKKYLNKTYNKEMVLDEKGNIWMGGIRHLVYYEIKSKLFKEVPLDKGKIETIDAVYDVWTEAETEQLWLATNKGIFIVTDSVKPFALQNTHCTQLAYNKLNQELWVSSPTKGLHVYKIKNKTWHVLNKISTYSTAVFIDDANNVWCGFDDIGIRYKSLSYNLFGMLPPINSTEKLYTKAIHAINSDTILIGTLQQGLFAYNIEKDTLFKHFKTPNGINAIHFINKNTILIGTTAGLMHYDFETNKLKKFINHASIISISNIKDYYFFATNNGLFFSKAPNITKLLPVKGGLNEKYNHLYVCNDSQLLAAPIGKPLQLFSLQKNAMLFEKSFDDIVGANAVSAAQGNQVWVSTATNLFQINLNTFKTFKKSIALNDLKCRIYGLIYENNQRIWITTNNGLLLFNPLTNSLNAYSFSDGLQGNEFNANAHCKIENTGIFMGGVDGVSCIFFHNFRLPEAKAKPYLYDIAINDEINNKLNTHNIGQITHQFSYKEKTLSFKIGGIWFGNSLKNQFEYLLKPTEKQFLPVTNDATIRFSNLKHGKYTLLVRPFGDTTSTPIAFWRFTIETPWYLNSWFWALCLLIFTAIIYYITNEYTAIGLKKRIIELEKIQFIEHERARIAQDLHDDLGSGLTKITFYCRNLQQKNNQEHSYLNKIEATSQALIDNMGHIVWAMKQQNHSFSSLIAYARQHAQHFLEDTDFEYTFLHNNNSAKESLGHQATRNLFLIFKEALHNAVKHSKGNIIKISFFASDTAICIQILDNGIGLKQPINDTGNGLNHMNKRATEIKATLLVKCLTGGGTKVELNYPW